MHESEIIALFQSNAPALDDCTILTKDEGNPTILWTTDALVEGTHFRLDWSSPEDLAARLVRCNHSDLCSSGAAAGECLLQLGLPANTSDDFLLRLSNALRRELQQIGCKLTGGDTFRAPQLYLALTMMGTAQRPILRSGGKDGDHLYLSGPLGLSLLGMRILESKTQVEPALREKATARFLRAQSRPDWTQVASGDLRVHAALDISDGFLADAPRLAAASDLALHVDLESIPLIAGSPLPLEEALSSGEEFEILFLGEPGLESDYRATRVGTARAEGPSGLFLYRKGQPASVENRTYEHF